MMTFNCNFGHTLALCALLTTRPNRQKRPLNYFPKQLISEHSGVMDTLEQVIPSLLHWGVRTRGDPCGPSGTSIVPWWCSTVK